MDGQHICGACLGTFTGEAAYNGHVCQKTGYTPVDVQHQDALTEGKFSLQAAEAQKRGAERAE